MLVMLHVVGELRELLRGDTQRFRRVRAHRRHYFVVQILDEFRDLFLQAIGSIVDGLAYTGRRVSPSCC